MNEQNVGPRLPSTSINSMLDCMPLSSSSNFIPSFGFGNSRFSAPPLSSVSYSSIHNGAPIPAISVDQLTSVINSCIEPIKTEIKGLRDSFSGKVKYLEDKITLLEGEDMKLQENNTILTDIVVNMQSSLNRLDGNSRVNNVIISRLPENVMNDAVAATAPIESDIDKVKLLFGMPAEP